MEDSMSRPPLSKRGEKRRRDKGKAKAIDQSASVRVTLPRRSSSDPTDHHLVGGTKHAAHASSRSSSKTAKVQRQAHADDTVQNTLPSYRHPGKPGESSSSVWECVPIARAGISRLPPLWSLDGRFYFTVDDTSIHVNSSTSPRFARLSTLSSGHRQGHHQPITSLGLSPTNPFQLLASSEDGTIKIWDWVEGRLVRTIPVNPQGKVNHFCLTEVLGEWWIFATVTLSNDKKLKSPFQVFRVPLIESKLPEAQPRYIVGRFSRPPVAIFASPRSTYVVALAGSKAYTFRLPTEPAEEDDPNAWKVTTVKFVSDQVFTCGAFAPDRSIGDTYQDEEWFATGDEKGVIRLWHGLGDAYRQLDGINNPANAPLPSADRRLPTTSLHWHAHAVAALAFTPTASQLLSVGEESVLVQWHLASGKKEFIPRLGGSPIVTLSVKPAARGVEEEWWMSLADGSTVRVGGASGHISNIGHGLRIDPLRPSDPNVAYPLCIHPASKSLVVPSSHPSSLQFIDLSSSSVLFDLEVAPSNRVSRRDEKEHEPVAVEKVAFSAACDGRSLWMATVESRNGDEAEGGGMVRTLKIWQWEGERYAVNTQYPRPHGLSNLVSLSFAPAPPSKTANPYLLTASSDGSAKVWQARQAASNDQGKYSVKRTGGTEWYWTTRSTFAHRSMPIADAVISPDATLIVLSHGPVITLWDATTNVMLRALEGGLASAYTNVAFVGQDGRHLVATGDKQGISVWDLLSCEILWTSTTAHCEHLITEASGSFFIAGQNAGFDSRTLLNVYSPSSPTPLRRQIRVSKALDHIAWLPEVSDSPADFSFVGVASSGEIYRFGDNVESVPTLRATSLSKTALVLKPVSIWQEMFGKDAFLDDLAKPIEANASTISAMQSRARKAGRPAEVFEGPSHSLPPMGLLFDAFMDEFLGEEQIEAKAEASDASGDIIYQKEEVFQPVTLHIPQVQGRIVTDAEMQDLEGFFKEVLMTKPAHTTTVRKATNLPNGHVSSLNGKGSSPFQHVNGHDAERDDIESDDAAETPARATPRPSRPSAMSPDLLNGQKDPDEEDQDASRDISMSGDKKRGKKRKASRVSGVL